MIDATHPRDVRSDDLLEILRSRGFEHQVVGRHAVVSRDAIRLVVPAPGRTLPDAVVRRLDFSLRPLLGRDWLDPQLSSESSLVAIGEPSEVLLLDAVVDRCSDDGQWCGFLPCEPTVMGFGPSRDQALRDLKEATALWIGIAVDSVVLMTPDVV